MAVKPDSAVDIVKRYIKELGKHKIHISEAIIFGSCVKGTAREESDIDIVLISDVFTGDRFRDRRKIDSRIELIPFKTEDFNNGGMLIEEIKRTGIVIYGDATAI